MLLHPPQGSGAGGEVQAGVALEALQAVPQEVPLGAGGVLQGSLRGACLPTRPCASHLGTQETLAAKSCQAGRPCHLPGQCCSSAPDLCTQMTLKSRPPLQSSGQTLPRMSALSMYLGLS